MYSCISNYVLYVRFHDRVALPEAKVHEPTFVANLSSRALVRQLTDDKTMFVRFIGDKYCLHARSIFL